jgi:hypothetical protein
MIGQYQGPVGLVHGLGWATVVQEEWTWAGMGSLVWAGWDLNGTGFVWIIRNEDLVTMGWLVGKYVLCRYGLVWEKIGCKWHC